MYLTNPDEVLVRETSAEDLGAAQFVARLNDDQLHHLQFSIPNDREADRLSRFLEEPRRVPVPNRFTFAPLDASNTTAQGQHSRSESSKSAKSLGLGKHSRTVSDKSTFSRLGSEGSAASRISGDLLREVEKVVSLDWRFYTTGACLCLVNLVAAWDATSLPIALPSIAAAVDASSFQTFWFVLCYLAASTCAIPLFRISSDIFGRKVILTALSSSALGSLIAAVTGTIAGLLVGRTIQGIGAGGIWSLSNLIVSDLVSTAARKRWSAFLGAAWAVGAITGPIIGGALAHNGNWRWIFWINLPFSVAIILILAVVARLTPAAPGTISSKLRTVDWVGSIILSGSLVSALLGITWAGTIRGWANVLTILCLIVGIIGLSAFAIWSWFDFYPSLISLDGFLNPSKLAVYLGALIQGMVVFAALHFLPLYFSVAKRSQSLIQISLALCAWSVPLAALALAAFFVASKTTMHRPLTWFAWFLVVLGIALMTILTRESGTVKWLCIALFSGFGNGILYPALMALAYATPKVEHKDDAVTNLAFFQSLGQTFGVAIGSSVLQNQLLKQLHKHPLLHNFAMRYVKDAFILVDIVRHRSSAGETLENAVADAFIASIRVIWVVMAALAAIAMVGSLLIRTDHVKQWRASQLGRPQSTSKGGQSKNSSVDSIA